MVLLAVGNRFAGDDGVAARVVGSLAGRLPAGVAAREVDGEPTRILDTWAGAAAAIVVDAARSDRPPGTVQRFVAVRAGTAADLDGLGRPVPTSSHGTGVVDAIALGGALGRLPGEVVVIAIEGERFEPGAGLSPAVAAAVPHAAETTRAEVWRLAGVSTGSTEG